MYIEEKKVGEKVCICPELLQAADVIERNGWCQNTYMSPKGSFCALGALRRVSNKHSSAYSKAVDRLSFYLTNTLHNYGYIPYWNDEPGRTKEEVIQTMRAAAYE